MQITSLSKPQTRSGRISKPSIPEEGEFFNQTLDKYQFPTPKATQSPKFFYRQYYGNSNNDKNGKTLSRTSTKMEGTRAMTSQSTKNSSRQNPENLISFLQTENPNMERIKTQSTLFKMCKRDLKSPYSEILEECADKPQNEYHLTQNTKIFYAKKKNENNNKFFLPVAPIYSKRGNYTKSQNFTTNFSRNEDEKIKEAQRKFLERKCFNDSDPFKNETRKCFDNFMKEQIAVKEENPHCVNLGKKNILNQEIIKCNDEPFALNSNFIKTFKMNSIIHKPFKEVTRKEILNNQMKAKWLNFKIKNRNCENKRLFLIVENLYLDEGNKNKLSYCYTQINFVFFIFYIKISKIK